MQTYESMFESLQLQIESRLSHIAEQRELNNTSEIRQLIHILAEAKYEPAGNYFRYLLKADQLDDEILSAVVSALGFHGFDLLNEVPNIETILKDKTRDEDLRARCAAVLGSMNSFHSFSALSSIVADTDDSEYVRESSVYALLNLGGINPIPRTIQNSVSAEDFALFGELSNVEQLNTLVEQIRNRA